MMEDIDMRSSHVDYFWEDVCQQQVKEIYDHYYQWYSNPTHMTDVYPVEQINAMVNYLVDQTEGLSKPLTKNIINSVDDNPLFFDIAGYAIYIIEELDMYYYIDWNYISDILIRKQKDYGPENIMRFGLIGIIVRMFDKIARLNNLIEKSNYDLRSAIQANSVGGETVVDTLIDIIGYSTIALMILDEDERYKNKFLTPMSPNKIILAIDDVE